MTTSTMIRWGMTALLVAHAVAHVPGFLNGWRLAAFPELPYQTTIFFGAVEVGDGGMRVVGTLWLAAALAFGAGAAGIGTSQAWGTKAVVLAAAASLVLCAMQWPGTRIGVAVNVVVLGIAAARVLPSTG